MRENVVRVEESEENDGEDWAALESKFSSVTKDFLTDLWSTAHWDPKDPIGDHEIVSSDQLEAIYDLASIKQSLRIDPLTNQIVADEKTWLKLNREYERFLEFIHQCVIAAANREAETKEQHLDLLD